MRAKDIIIDFINHTFLLALTAFFIFYFTVGNRFENFIELMHNLMPIAFFLFIFSVAVKIKRMKMKELKNLDILDKEIILRLNYFDELKGDILIFLLPLIILLTAFFVDGFVAGSDILQAAFVLALVYWWKAALFKKKD